MFVIIQFKKEYKLKDDVILERERLAHLGEVTAGVVHNLKTPVMSISGSLEALKELVDEYERSIGDGDVTDEDHYEIAREMRDYILKSKPYCSYISDIITTVKDQAAKRNSSENESFTIEDMMKRVEILMGYVLKKSSCRINIKMDKTFQIKGDINELVQAMNNFISNSIESYKGDAGKIDILIDKEDDMVKFKITDYGSGIPENIRKKLLKNVITTKGKKGTGIGVYMSYYIIRHKFNGSMKIESSEGKGTTIYINIPAK
ncbi:HAMP domain-containing sensor histidine kinase [Herbivorax sp. ANBcel31]|uniref:sensor histidine kinase n=1 Tax=Herbivorax sp. ANBcel31 TaxID=3069754 RepID=UPI0027AF4473|nr:HAMP domain-containing sensor histidine kinase [Herbivorax sp. ANBcel31]MDQ2087620.1 HAMP domain-containing sensor histidine kinase [Herbivorax sp. ANBcel31]